MKKSFLLVSLLTGFLCLSFLGTGDSYAVSIGQAIKFADGPGTTGGGEFLAYDWDSKSYMFTSFCLETNEYLNFSGKFIVQDISTEARNGGSGGGNPDPLSQYSAYLYHNFYWGILEQYAYTGATARFANRAASANALQEAIWWFENETLGKTNYYTELALNAVNSGNWWGLGDVCVINLVDANGNRAQDQITVVPLEELATITGAPVPEPATMVLLGFGLVGLGLFGREKLKR